MFLRFTMPGLLLICLALGSSSCAKLGRFTHGDRPRLFAAGPRIGAVAPELDGEDFDGKRVRLSDQRGKVVVVVFWASWCRPCREMIPHERDLAERFRDRPFTLISVNNDEDHDAAKKVITSQGMNWTQVKTTGTDDPICRRWSVRAWPSVFVIDARGVLRYTRVSGPNLDAAVESLFAETTR